MAAFNRASVLAQLKILKQFAPTTRRKKIPKQLPPDGITLEYYSALRSMIADMESEIEREVLPLLPQLARADRMDASDKITRMNNALDRASQQFLKRWPRPRLEALAAEFAAKTSAFQRMQLARQIKASIGVDVFREPNVVPRLAAFTAENVSLIKSVPTKYFDDVEKLVTRAATDGIRHETIAKQIRERTGASEKSARLIARDQVGKLYGAIQKDRQEALAITDYFWRTSNDERVRDEHAVREGEKYSWDSPPEDGHPGEAILCRCSAEPDFSKLLEDLK